MKSTLRNLFLLVSFFLTTYTVKSQSYSYQNAVLASATVQNSPAKIILSWPTYTAATGYTIYRKTPSSSLWGAAVTTISGASTSYTDNSVTAGTLYEYNIRRAATGSTVIANGYVTSGIETKLSYNKGNIILVIDNFFVPALNADLNQLIKDYEGDGWFVKKVFVNRGDAVSAVKTKIVAAYNEDAANTKSLMLLGHVPVPYSGDNNPDGHPDHKGAWPADGFYADMDGVWGDSFVNDVSASDSRNKNIPGDGKYDEDVIPTILELQVGRVDFNDLPAFSSTETQLMKKYLYKLHAFKTRKFIPLDKGVVEDQFTGYAEGFAGAGYTNFASMFGAANVTDVDFVPALTTGTVNLWAYGTGGGNYVSASGVVATSDFAADSIRSVFVSLFGSYFGDWDSQNNLLRSALGSGAVLSCSWSGRPWWHYHQMAMGEDLGYCAKNTQNSNNLYFSSTLGCMCGYIQNGQMGDPSLRLHYIAPPSNVIATNDDATGTVSLSWTASSETVLGYNVYRRDTLVNSWTLLTASPISATTYTDNTITAGGAYSYMVRATRLQTTGSGTYYNLSLGAKNGINSIVSVKEINNNPIGFSVFPNPFENTFYITSKQNLSKVNLTVSDVLGKKVFEKETDFIQNETVPVNLSGVDAGIYFITVNQQTFKVVKNK